MTGLREYTGSCHCGAVAFRVRAPAIVEVERCNCSICRRSGYLHLIVPSDRFDLERGDDMLSCYQFNTGVARHYFCKVCGIKPFYIPRSNPDGVDVNLNCLDTLPDEVHIEDFDGENWEDNAHKLAHKSKATNAPS